MVWPYVLGLLAGGIVYLAGKSIADSWGGIQKENKGKNLAVLGPRDSGKTTLVKFLLNGEISEEYVATAKPEKFSGRKLKLKDLELVINDTIDVPGDIRSHDDWARLYMYADIALYLVDASRIDTGDEKYEATVRGEMRHIGEWFNERKDKPPRFFLVATHCDLIPEYVVLPGARKAEFTDALWGKSVMQDLILYGQGTKNVKCVAGSLKGQNEIERLVGDIFRQVTA
ncbi:hypothetical protein IP70_08370 [alpha proteobacterium AAP38]|nr:hypothetical protein IP70_08370 [alpha proteobacterium AAP38]